MVWLTVCVGNAPAQPRPTFNADDSPGNSVAAQFAAACFTLMGVMLILCMPSRKRTAE